MEAVDTQTIDQEPKEDVKTGASDPDPCLRQLWKTSLLVQGRVDSRSGVVGDADGRAIGEHMIDLTTELLGIDDLKFAQSLLIRGASLKSKKQDQQLFPAGILNKCFFKSRGGTLRSGHGYGEDAASYAAADSTETGSGTKQFGEDIADHLKSLKEKLSGEPSEDDGKAIEELALYSLSHVTSVFKDDVRQVARDSKPFEIASRAIMQMYENGPGLSEAFDKQSVIQAYCGSVLNRLESIERLGVSKSTKLFNKYLAGFDKTKSGISLDKIVGDHPLNSFPELHHLPATEFITLAGGDASSESEKKTFLDLLSGVANEITLSSRELSRFDAYTNLHFSQEFQIKENETRMEPVKHCAATRQLMSSYRQVRTHLGELGILGAPCRHYFGWYSIPRVMEAFLMGQCESLTVTGVLPLGVSDDPWSESLSDLRMEYRLAKVQRNFYEPPLTSSVSSAFVHLSWEIEVLGVARDGIKLESSDEAAGTFTLSFDYANVEDSEKMVRREITYTTGDISGAQPADLSLPTETDPVLFKCPDGDLPAALLFVGDNVVKELPLYNRFSYGKNVALYILESKIAPKVRKERTKFTERAAKKAAAKAAAVEEVVEVIAPEPVEPELTGIAKVAGDLLKADKDLNVLSQDTLAWTKEVLEKIASDQKVTGKLRRNFRRLHNQLKHREGRGFSNRVEGDFMNNLAGLSRQFDAEAETS